MEEYPALRVIGRPLARYQPGSNVHYKTAFDELLRHDSRTLAEDVIGWLPSAIAKGYEAVADGRKFGRSKEVAYWNGENISALPYPNEELTWSDDYTALAMKVAELIKSQPHDPITIIDFGGGTGALSFHIAAQLEDASSVRFVNIDCDPFAFRFSAEFAKRHKLNFSSILIDVAEALESAHEMELLANILQEGNGRKILVTRGGLHPFFSNEQYAALFDFFVKHVGVGIGAHLEFNGFRTNTYIEVIKSFEEPPIISDFWKRDSDPFAVLISNSNHLGIDITERIDIWPHYQGVRISGLSNWPSYLAWRRVTSTQP